MRHPFSLFLVIMLASSIIGLHSIPTIYAADVSAQYSVGIKSSFNGLYYGYQGNTFVPPDVEVAVGPNHVVQMVNVIAGIYAKNGSLLKSVPLTSIFNAGTDDLTDPRLCYDSTIGRWIASIADMTTNNVIVAISNSGDPMGQWSTQVFSPRTPGSFPDQPGLGVTLDKIVTSFNSYDTAGNLIGAEFFVINKSMMLAGNTADYVDFGPYTNYFSIHPAVNFGSTSNQYMVSVDPTVTGSFNLFSVVGTAPTNVRVTNVTIPISSSSLPVDGIQKGTRTIIDASDGRLLSAIWYQSKLWFTFAVSQIFPGDNRLRSSFKLVQVNTDTNTVLQDFVVGANGFSYYYPVLAVDGIGNLFVLFGYSSANDYPGLMVTSQASTGANGTYLTPVTVIAGTGPETSGRYGDYFGATVDPSNPLVVWEAGEYGTPNRWATRIASFSVATLPINYPIQWGVNTYPVTLVSNSAISNFNFSQSIKQLSYRIEGASGTAGFSNITIPKALMSGTFNVQLDGRPITFTLKENANITSLYFTYTHTSHTIIVMSTNVIPEFPIPIIMLAVTLTAAIFLLKIGKKCEKLSKGAHN